MCGDSAKPEDVDRLLDGAQVHLVHTDPPYNVKLEPRSNNAMAAGLSSFPGDGLKQKQPLNQSCHTEGLMHHQALDLARQPRKAKPTSARLRAEDWQWSSAYGGHESRPVLDPGPASRPARLRAYLNQPQTEAEVVRLRECSRRRRPYGDAAWTVKTARRLDDAELFHPVARLDCHRGTERGSGVD